MPIVETEDRVLPWQHLGHQTKAKTAKTALKQAGLDWTVSLRPAGYLDSNGKWQEAEDRRYVVRDDTDDFLGEVSKTYTPLQNVDAFEFFDEVITTGDVEYDTVGSLSDGRSVWLTARVPEPLMINGIDPVELYLLLRNSHDGSSSVNLAITPVRVWCQNTIVMALRRAVDRWNVRHVVGVEDRVQEAQQALGLTFKFAEQFEEQATELAQLPMSNNEFDSFIGKLSKELDLGERADEQLKERTTTIFHESSNLENVRGTRWAAFNSVTDYYEWDRPRTDNARLKVSWGEYARGVQQTALRLLK